MKISFYGYNTFVIKSSDKVIAIDPGASFYLPDFFKPLIPKVEWPAITHILVTHGDPDHHWHTDRVAEVSNAAVVCNQKMIRNINGKNLILGPRARGLSFTTEVKNIHPVKVNETITVDDVQITGIRGTHGPLTVSMGPFSKTLHEGPQERMGYGEMGFEIQVNGTTIVNLGDTLLFEEDWKSIANPDILMVPIGGSVPGNTMSEQEALKAVEIIKPAMVIPCHYNCGALFSKCYNPADDQLFKQEVEKLGIECIIMNQGETIQLHENRKFPLAIGR